MMKKILIAVFSLLLFNACYQLTDAQKQLLKKYEQADKYRDFDIFQFKGIGKLSPDARPPYVQMIETKDSSFLLIAQSRRTIYEEKFKKMGDYRLEQQIYKAKDGDSLETFSLKKYLFKTYYLEIYRDISKLVKNPNKVEIEIDKVTSNSEHGWIFKGDKRLSEIKISPDFKEKEFLGAYLTDEIKANLVPTDSCIIRQLEYRDIEEDYFAWQKDTVEYYYDTDYDMRKYSFFWQIYVVGRPYR